MDGVWIGCGGGGQREDGLEDGGADSGRMDWKMSAAGGRVGMQKTAALGGLIKSCQEVWG